MSRARTFADLATASEEGSLANRNYFYNGDMQIYQRGSTAVASDSIARTLDRWRMYNYSDGAVTVTQDTNAPSATAFTKSLKIDVTTADSSIGADEVAFIQQRFEGQDLQNFLKGTSSAKKGTLQFWVSSPKTGTHIVEWYDTDNSRQISKTYTISSANTWEFKTITFDADTTGTWNNDNLQSLEITWWLCAGTNFTSGTLNTTWGSVTAANRAVGQVNVFDNTSNNFYLTGVQLELGEVATPFKHETYIDSLARCQRYFQISGTARTYGIVAAQHTATNCYSNLRWWQLMRAAPTVTIGATSAYNVYNATENVTISDIDAAQITANSCELYATMSSRTAGTATHINTNGDTTFWKAESEL
tara:strand:+ start:1491 stop:2573 length:1083 start_codon:yes stop_codon:yes gene_type:complete